MTTRVFVYGTLLPGESNHALLAGAHRLGPARTADAFAMVDLGGFPAVVPAERRPHAAGPVAGEVWEVDQATLARLDALEDHPRWYRRESVRVEDGGAAEIYVLAIDPGGAPTIPTRTWRP